MTRSIWDEFYQQPTLAVSTEKYTKLLHDSTSQLHQSLEPILSALDRRALAFTKLASFESALRDAKLIQQLSPYSALGYLCEAKIYSEQGKQHHVIDICGKGLSMADTMDTHYDTLRRLKEDAEQRQNVCIDFVTQLPCDIVVMTIIPMFTDYWCLQPFTPWPYLHVSNQWRERVIQSLDGLRFMTDCEEMEYMGNDSQIAKFSRHVISLNIGQFTKGTWLGDLIRNNDFCSLHELLIDRKLTLYWFSIGFIFNACPLRLHSRLCGSLGFVIQVHQHHFDPSPNCTSKWGRVTHRRRSAQLLQSRVTQIVSRVR